MKHVFRRQATQMLVAALSSALLLSLQACGGGGTDRSNAQIRLVNATSLTSGYEQLALRLDDQQRQGQVAYGGSAGYAEVDSGTPTLAITRQSSTTALLTSATSLTKGRYYTTLAYGNQGALRQVLLDDNQGDPDVNKSLLRVINAMPEGGNLDVYLTGSEESLNSSVPLQSAAAYGNVGAWLTVASGTWRLRVTAAGSKTDVRLDVPDIGLASRQITTLVLTPGSGGVLGNALLLTQRGGIARMDNTQARVRVAIGLHGGGTVTTRVAGSLLTNNTPSQTVGLYSTVTAGTQPVQLSVGGVAVAMPDKVLAAGGDYTLLVHGSTSAQAQAAGAPAPRGSWLQDDNRGPSDSSQVRLRLINGLADAPADSPGLLALTVDAVSVADSVAAGAASLYADAAANATAIVTVVGSNGKTLFDAIDRPLVAGGTYSVLLVGSAAAPVGILRKDR